MEKLKTTEELLSYLVDNLDIQLWVEGDRLKFNAPKGTLTPELRTQIKEQKAEIIAFLQSDRERQTLSRSDGAIERIDRDSDIPLSWGQEQLWFLHQLLEGNSSAYSLPFVLQLTGELNINALEQSLTEIISRHEVLRTRFQSIGGKPHQVIAPECKLNLPIIDLRELSEPERSLQVQQLAVAEAKQPFDLEQTPLLRASLLQLEDQKHILLLNIHHIAFDAWSWGIFIKELSVIYTALSSAQRSPLAELPIQYADYASWQRQRSQGEVLETQLNYWKQQLGGELPVLQLPLDYTRPPMQTYTGGKKSFKLSSELTSSLKELSKQEGVTLYMTLLAAFKLLLSRYSGQSDIIVGTPVANRRHSEIEGLIGFFVNTLALRTDLGGNPSFRELLGRVLQVTLGAYDRQDISFEKLVKELQPERYSTRNPLFQVMFTLQNFPQKVWEFSKLIITQLENEKFAAQFDLSLDIWETEMELQGEWEYNTDLFEGATIERMNSNFSTLLEGIVANPEQKLGSLPLLTPKERHQLLVEWNDTKALYPQDKCIHQLFEEQVQDTPDAVAVVFEEEQITYRELNAKANQLAHYLQNLGVGPEVLVGICMERSLEMIIGLLGIIKAGGAYVPLEPNYPSDRLAYMLEDSGVSVLLTSESLLEQLPSSNNAKVVLLDADGGAIASQSQDHPTSSIEPDNLMYVIYTSGSTGQPKGVMNAHQGVVNRLLWMQEAYPLTHSDRVLQKTPFSFDVSVWEFFWPLLTGASLVVAKPSGHKDSIYLANLIASEQITTVHFVPAMLQVFLEQAQLERCSCLKRVFCSGEALTEEVQKRFFTHLGCKLHNLYGPTEAAIDVTFWECKPESKLGIVPIGRPIANTQIYILDKHLQPVPIGVPGELYIGGAGLARGYLNRPELTEQKFIPNPFSNEPSSRLYKTGDLARYLSDGNIEFIGRIDNQVKIRGFRIELGEIEATLAQHPDLRQFVAIAREDNPGDKRLVAYLIAKESPPVTSELRSFLKTKLPDYMIPATFVILESLPLTPNGKVNRRALPAPELDSTTSAPFVPPQTPAQELLAAIIASVLGIQRCGIHDNFFELGGHSLLATQVISRLRETFTVEMPLRSIFEAPTVAQLEAQLNRIRKTQEQLPIAPAIVRVSREKDLPLSFAQERLWFLHQLEEGDTSAYNMPRVLQLIGELDINVLEQSLTETIGRHEVLRTCFKSVGGIPLQVIESDFQLPVPVIDLRELSEAEQSQRVEQLATAFAKQPFDLEQTPLLRASILQLSNQKHILLLNVHHIAFDGWSWGILRQELSVIYQALSSGKPSPLAELPIQYADYAAWQRQWLQGEVLEGQLNYWKQQLSGELPVLELPLDYPRPRVQTFTGGKKSFQLSQELTSSLKDLSRQEGVTLYMTLLAAFNVLLSRYSGQSDIIIGTPIANRDRTELEGTIGFFVNTLVLRTDLGGNPSFGELMGRVREVTLGAYAHKELPFEKLVEQLQPERDLSRNPLFQVWFDMVNVPRRPLSLPGLTVENLFYGVAQSKFDLTLYVRETDRSIQLTLAYNAELFSSLRMSQLLEHYQYLLEQIVTNPQQKLSGIALLRNQQKHYPPIGEQITPGQAFRELALSEIEQSLPDRFSQQVRQYPQNLAIKTKNYQWTYAELERTANEIAGIVLNQCGDAEQRIALLLEQDAPAIAAILGVLKAGKTYVPLDPSYPRERLAYILEDSQATAVATNYQNWELAVELSSNRIKLLDIEGRDKGGSGPENQPEIAPDQLAYILYTSGSTGVPKGVMQNHRNVLHFIRNYTNNLKIAPDDKLTLLSSISFDAAIMDIFAALLNGATLYPFDIKSEGLAPLPEYMSQEGITIYHSTPTVFRHLENHLLETDCLPQLRLIVLGGEEVKPQDVQLYQQHFSEQCILVNGLGPTESTVTLQYFIDRQTEVTNKVPVGYPIEETEIILFDDNGQVTDFYGEIGIRSPYIALGYWRQPQRTDKVFLADPEGGNKRIYRTGDLGRLRPDGTLEFVGRKDFQVKLRGYRIELGEIEAVLLQHPQVKEAVVIVREDNPGDKRLVAYLIAKELPPVTSELRSFLKTKLPDYMIPATFVILESLPLTPNGKVNRRALPAPELDSTTSAPFVPPQTPAQELLAAIIASVLGIQRCSIHDNFFELGGHSLLATQVISRLRETFAVEMPLRSIFEAPTVAQLEAQLNRRIQNDEQLPIAPAIKKISREQDLPLSFAQERLWFLHQLEQGDTSAYNMPRVLQLIGELDINVLEQSLTETIGRHEVLRTCFKSVGGIPLQVIESDFQLGLPLIDLQELSEPEQSQRVEQLATAFAKQPFDLEQTPLLRASILQLSHQKHILLLNVHHIAFDGWSWGILRQELSVIYQALSSGKPSPLAELPIQYADYAAWQRQWLQGEVLETQLNYWKQQLSGELPVLELPLDYPRPRVATYTGGKESFQLSQELTSSLKELSRQEGVTLYMTLLAAFNVLLSRYSGQSDLIIGTPIANRDRKELEGLIGFFVNTLVLRTDLGGNPSFRELLGRVREVTLGAYAHKDLPFEKLVEQLQPERDLSRNPLFQVMFALQNSPPGKLELSHLTVTPLKIIDKFAVKFDLSLDLWETETGLQGSWQYNKDLFESATIERTIGNFETLLQGIVARRECQVDKLPLLTARERHQLLVKWNDTSREYPLDKCIHQLFEEQVERTPERIAVIFENRKLTYREVNQKANQLAHLLKDKGVTKGKYVPVLMERSVELLLAHLAIMKAGAAFVPIDPKWPITRIIEIFNQLNTEIFLVNQSQASWEDLSNWSGVVVNELELTAPKSNLNLSTSCTEPIYVIFTSGSTGTPKGAINQHRGITNRFLNMNDRYGTQENDVILCTSNHVFDSSVWQLFWPLINGNCTAIVPPNFGFDPHKTIELIEKAKVTITDFVPSVFNILVTLLEKQPKLCHKLSSLRHLVIGGEAMNQKTIYKFKSYFPEIGITNAYGPSETSIGTIFYEVPSVFTVPIPIGRPLFNVYALILDRNLNLVPIGVPGELYLGGVCVGLGYLNDEAKTRSVFIPNPFSEIDSDRLYKTGDLVRYLPDGNIEFLDRIDRQVKIRGIRIELGEIEANLIQHPMVREAVVMIREDASGDKRLIVYIVPDESQPTISQLRSFLKSKLPDYMMPSAFVVLEAIPLTPNGKIDRRALPVPDVSTQEAKRIAPRTTTELQLVQIWSEVLNLPAVGVRDNFFDLGGHSLLAVRLMARIEEQLGTRLPLGTLFSEPTIEGQASLLSAAVNPQLFSPLVPIQPKGSVPPFFCVHPVGGNVLCYAALARQLGAEQPFYALQALGLNGDSKPKTCIEDMAATYIKAIQTIRPQGPYRLGGWSFGGIVAFEMARQLEALGAEVETLALIDSFNPTVLNRSKQDEAMQVISFAKALSGHFDKKLPVSAEELRQLGLEEKLNYILNEGKKVQILPPEIGLEQMQQLFAVFQANSQAMHSYVPPPYSGQITLFYAEEKTEQLTEQQIQGWSSLATGGINVRKIPGDHFSIIRSEALAKELGTYLRF